MPGVGDALIQDIARNGKRLIFRSDVAARIWFQRANAAPATDISWLDVSFFPKLFGDATMLVFRDALNVVSANYATMLRPSRGAVGRGHSAGIVA